MSCLHLLASSAFLLGAATPLPPPLIDPTPTHSQRVMLNGRCDHGIVAVEIDSTKGRTRLLRATSGNSRAKASDLQAINARLARLDQLGPVLLQCADDGLVLTLRQLGKAPAGKLQSIAVIWTPHQQPRFIETDERGSHG